MQRYQEKNIVLNMRRQGGAALLVALVVLAVMTIIGVANMNSAGLEMKLVASTATRNDNFALAEIGLEIAEQNVRPFFTMDDNRLFTNQCGDSCFTPTCDEGRCFEGAYNSILQSNPSQCEVAPNADTVPRTIFWSDPVLNVWEDDTKHIDIPPPAGSPPNSSIKYIVEFLCFLSPTGRRLTPADDEVRHFRITLRAEDGTGRTPVMLQVPVIAPRNE